MPTAPFMWLDDKVVPYADARIHAFSGVVKYGCGVFEGLRGYWDEPKGELFVFRLHEHLERLRFGMKVMRFETIYDEDFLAGALLETLRANELRCDVHIRMIAYLAGDEMLDQRGPVGLVIGAVPRPSLGLAKGIHVQVGSWRRISDSALPPRVKCTGNYVNNRAAEIEARQDGYDGVLMLTGDGKLSEGSGACLFIVRDGTLITPDPGSDILESITRDTVLQLAPEITGRAAVERRVDRTELQACDEAFLCGSGQEIQPILSVDRMPVGGGGAGPVTAALQERYFAIVRGQSADHMGWLTPVWNRKSAGGSER
jgi:branched-chain amino acid aminotransferase